MSTEGPKENALPLNQGVEMDKYFDLGDFHRTVTTNVPEAQLWFDRGFYLSYGFNHEEAIRCFKRVGEQSTAVAELDSRFDFAWKRADVAIKASCYCRVNK